jgi:hypothetical protein
MADAHPSNRLARGVPTRRRDRRLLFVIMLMMSATGCRNGEMPLAGIPGLDDIIRAPGDDGARNRPPDHLIPLYEWYSAARGDHFTTSDPDWAGEPGIERAGYRLVRIAGYVFDPARPQPQNTIPMVSWYSPGRGDNFLTTQVNNYEPEYRRVRLEGYVFAQSYAGTVPLHRWYNRERTDNFTTTSPFWQGAIGEARQGYVKSRVAGHLYPPPPAEGDAVAFGWGSTRATGIRPLLVIHQDLATHRVQRDAAWFEELIFGERRATHPATVPVHTWWNADTRRSIATTHADWAGQAADRRAPE